MSVKDNVRDTSDGQCDFEKVNGMEGIYIASTYDPSRAERYKSLISGTSDDDIQVEKKKNKRTGVSGEDLKDFTDSLIEFKKTKITKNFEVKIHLIDPDLCVHAEICHYYF